MSGRSSWSGRCPFSPAADHSSEYSPLPPTAEGGESGNSKGDRGVRSAQRRGLSRCRWFAREIGLAPWQNMRIRNKLTSFLYGAIFSESRIFICILNYPLHWISISSYLRKGDKDPQRNSAPHAAGGLLRQLSGLPLLLLFVQQRVRASSPALDHLRHLRQLGPRSLHHVRHRRLWRRRE